MCGIAGIVGTEFEPQTLARMGARLRHRGPDDAGQWLAEGAGLAHTRLAVLDLSSAGHQPMQLGDYVISYNGEIYNYQALRRELPGPFHSATDTEVILKLYARDGERCVERLRGMFAFAIYDQRRRRLFAARDRLGIKPLHYRRLGSGLAFASELKALQGLGPDELDASALRDYFSYGYVPAPKTIYRGTAKLPAAHTLTFEQGRLTVRRYWAPSPAPPPADPQRAAGALDELLRAALAEQAIADVPVGVFLSGGVDSATVAYYLGRPRTFTVDFKGAARSEAAAARAAAEALHTEHHEIGVDAGSLEQALETLSGLYDEPFADSAAWPAYLVSRAARRAVTVALSGEGGDELFAGYPRYRKGSGERSNLLTRTLARALPPLSTVGHSMQRRAGRGLPGYAALLGLFTPREQQRLLHPALLEPGYDPLWHYRQYWREDLPPLLRMRWLDLHTNLPDGLLTKIDRASMAHSLEVRPPLLDHRLVDFALGLPPQLLLDADRRRGKRLLRELMRPRLPAGHLERPKQGFGIPVRRWLLQRPEALSAALARLARAGIVRSPPPGRLPSAQAWAILALDRWVAREGAYSGAEAALRRAATPSGGAGASRERDAREPNPQDVAGPCR